MNGFEDIIKLLEAQKAAIERALEALREVGGEVAEGSGTPKVTTSEKRPAGRKAKRTVKEAVEAAPAKPKGGMTPEGRQKLADAMKRRWATKRTAAQAKKRPGRPKKAAPTA